MRGIAAFRPVHRKRRSIGLLPRVGSRVSPAATLVFASTAARAWRVPSDSGQLEVLKIMV